MGINYNSSIVTSGLLIHYDGANPRSYAGSGSTWFDVSGNNNNGTIRPGVTYAQSGFTIDAQGEGIVMSYASQNTWSLSVWFKKNAVGSSVARVAGTGPTTDRGELGIFTNTVWVNSPTSGNWHVTAATVADGEIANLVVCFDTQDLVNNNTFLYKNATNFLARVDTTPELPPPTSYTLGARADFNTEWLPCTIYMASLYSKILTQAEVTQNFNAFRGRFGL